MVKINAKSKNKGEDEEIPIHEEREISGEKGDDDVRKENADEVISEKEELLILLKKLKDMGINSISDLEVKISRL